MRLVLTVILGLGFALSALARTTTNEYATIDAYALQTPVVETESVDRLASYLVKPARNDREKARTLYRWVAQNIDYDVESFFSGTSGGSVRRVITNFFYGTELPDAAELARIREREMQRLRAESANEALKKRKAVCAGYSHLFQALGRAAGLDVEVVDGYARGYGFTAGVESGRANHAWNVVKIDGKWQLVDVTWGAGYVGDDRKFSRQFKNSFFLSPPEQFIYSHLPTESKWQLLARPLSSAEFNELVFLRSPFFRYDLKLLSHSKATIHATDEVTVTFAVPAGVELSARLEQGGKELPQHVFCQREGDVYAIHSRWPSPDRYSLYIFGRRLETTNRTSRCVAMYGINGTGGTGAAAAFPVRYSSFEKLNARLLEPLVGRLTADTKVHFSLCVPGADQIIVVMGSSVTPLTRDGDKFSGDVSVVRGAVNLFAHPTGETAGGFTGLVSYTAD
jgi:hypothetical protein